MYICICLHVYIHRYKHRHTHTHIHTQTCTHTHIHQHTHTRSLSHAHTQTFYAQRERERDRHRHTYTQIHTHINTHTHTHTKITTPSTKKKGPLFRPPTPAHTHAHKHILTHTRTHTHTHQLFAVADPQTHPHTNYSQLQTSRRAISIFRDGPPRMRVCTNQRGHVAAHPMRLIKFQLYSHFHVVNPAVAACISGLQSQYVFLLVNKQRCISFELQLYSHFM